MSYKELLSPHKMPSHVAIIMDGNGRWAKSQGKPRVYGHHQGVKTVKEIVEAAGDLRIRYVTLYAFSTENWNRPKIEVDTLMSLLSSTIDKEIHNLLENNIRLQAIGDLDALPRRVKNELLNAIEQTSHNDGLHLTLALSYSSRWEITDTIKRIAHKIKDGSLLPEDISEQTVNEHLATANLPDPELLIRTSGENRVSNFLLWQLAYCELYFSSKYWPAFQKEDFFEAVYNFQQRERRFGKISEQIVQPNNLVQTLVVG